MPTLITNPTTFGVLDDVWVALILWAAVIALAVALARHEERARADRAADRYFDTITRWHAEVAS